MTNKFNLVDEAWIPVVGASHYSLRDIFSKGGISELGGNPLQKAALFKFLQALGLGTLTPSNREDWLELGPEGFRIKVLDYLEKNSNKFNLYGPNPFLQFPSLGKAKVQPFGGVLPEVSTGNATVLTQVQQEKDLSNGEIALLLICLMGFGLGGKKTDNSVVLSEGYEGKLNDKGKPSTGKPGPSLGFLGYLHNFLFGDTICESIWLNLLTLEEIRRLEVFPEGVGVPPWEEMPAGENCPVAVKLKHSLMGRLIPLSRFCLISKGGFHLTEGILYPNHLEGIVDPSVAINRNEKKPRVIWADPEKKPWRYLPSLLSFLGTQKDFDCFQIRLCLAGAVQGKIEKVGLWCGGLKVSSNAGEQYVSGGDDFIESRIEILLSWMGEKGWWVKLKQEMEFLEHLEKILFCSVRSFFKDQKMEGEDSAKLATRAFWGRSETLFEELLKWCERSEETNPLRKKFFGELFSLYDRFTRSDTSRQLASWVKNRPNLNKEPAKKKTEKGGKK